MDPKLIDRIANARAIVDRQATSFQAGSPPALPPIVPTIAAWDTRTSTLPSPTEPPAFTPAAPFRPLFALVTDPLTGEVHHPTVHYVFSDDEADGSPLTAAALQAIEDQEDATLSGAGEVEERVVVLDLQSDGKILAGVTSLSEAWQGLRTEVGVAPSWGAGKGEGVMVKVTGKAVDEKTKGESKKAEGLEALVERFEAGMERLSEVMGAEDGKGEGVL
ncbi:hypothetical protein B0A48_02084 [Cryoendolithus antarcticus]|uniref:Uncharacterized protein n=1 Tax=Cryoendolithus antarcticus TaxID=1507870 RepID=A0A1V8TN33_9PEZI|nr:hypothetical protein B0A48_02084 [Cryoendolithus antarcticus]